MSVHEATRLEPGTWTHVTSGVADVFVVGGVDRLPVATVTAGADVPGCVGVDIVVVGRGDAVLTTTTGPLAEGEADGVRAFLSAAGTQVPAVAALGDTVVAADLPEQLGAALRQHLDVQLQARAARSQTSADRDRQDLEAAFGRMVADIDRPGSARSPLGLGMLASVLAVIGARQGFDVTEPSSHSASGRFDPLAELARASGVRYRNVALVGAWELDGDADYLGVLLSPDGPPRPVALLKHRRGYRVQEADADTSRPLTTGLKDALATTAFEFYPPLARGRKARWSDIAGLAVRGTARSWVVALLAGLGIALLGLATPILTKSVLGWMVPQQRRSLIVSTGAALGVAALLSGVFALVQSFSVAQITLNATRGVQASFWDRVLSLPPRFFRRYSAGDLTVRVMAVDQIQRIVSAQVIGVALAATFASVNLILLFRYSVTLALVAMGILGLSVVVIVLVGRKVSVLASDGLHAQRRSSAWLVQLLTGVGKVRIAGAEDRFTGQYIDQVREQAVATARQTGVMGLMGAYFSFAVALGPALFFLFIDLGWRGSKAEIDPATFVAFVSAYQVLFGSVTALSAVLGPLASIRPTLEMIQPLLDELPEGATHLDDPGTLRGQVELRGVSFRYGPNTPLVLHDLHLSVEPGQMLALVGPSGSGKSSITRLMLGFDDPEAGQVLFDGRDLASLDLDRVREQFGVVMQDGKIMHGTIKANILGNGSLSDEDAWVAAESAALADDIRAMPMGLMTMVEPSTLSGGQAQRILMARALVRKPAVLILDEATSALDNESQAHVAAALEALGSTRIVIAHRLSTIRHADSIAVIVAGEVVEQGTYDELIALDGFFASLARRQIA
jgi:ATP-binding cassette subfamily C protein